jgi:hypothetical protein
MAINCNKVLETAKSEVEGALRKVGNRSLSLQLSGSERPWNLARALCEYGFNVESVSASEFELSDDDTVQYDDADLRWIAENRPEITLLQEEREGIHGFRGRGGFGGEGRHGHGSDRHSGLRAGIHEEWRGHGGEHGFGSEGGRGHGGEGNFGGHGNSDRHSFGGHDGHGGNSSDAAREVTALWGYAALSGLLKLFGDTAQGLEMGGKRQ